jgi:methionine sulfoxide reductase catalytic subunit
MRASPKRSPAREAAVWQKRLDMIYLRKRGWEMPASAVTPEAIFLGRREFLAGAGALIAGLGSARGALADDADPSAPLYPAKRNEAFKLDRGLTPEKINLNYNNFYEYTTSKHVDASALKTRPWTVKIDGLVEKEQTIDIDALIRSVGLEERLYRHRCVEAWSMTIPWTGFPLRALVEKARPLSGAKYVRFETFLDKKMAPGQRSFMPWPYVEGLTMAEATNDLAFIATGTYGKPLAKVQGAPIRLATPWKYGFKSIKSIVRVSFVDKRPETFWETLGPDEYGFWANVNPDVPHPRWSQAKETFLNDGQLRPTLIYNGYGAEVAGLYKGLESEPLYM